MPVSLVPQSVAGHVNAVRDLAPTYWKGVSDLTVRNFLTFYMLRKYGAMTFNARGHSQVWNARVKLPQVSPAVDGQPLEFVNWDTDIQYYIGVKGFRGSDMMGEQEYLQSQGASEQMTYRYDRKSKELGQAMTEALSHSFYKDGNLPANAYIPAGIKTALGYDDATLTAADKVARPSGSYAGQNCALGSLGGSWPGMPAGQIAPNASLGKQWPFGQGNPEYDGTSGLIINYASPSWGTGSTTWGQNAVAATSWAQTAALHRGGTSMVGAPMNVVMASEMFTDMKQSFRDNNRQIMPWTDGDLGYPGETLKVDGMVFSMDYAIPYGEAFGFLPQYIEAFFLHNDIFGPIGPEYSMPHVAYLYYVSSYGNFKFLPKYCQRYVSKT